MVKIVKKFLLLLFSLACIIGMNSCKKEDKKTSPLPAKTTTSYYTEDYRPQFHFSPQEKWINDPNGLVYNDGVYHLFYQYYPDSTVWGPMHWGHAVSEDMLKWKHKPVALYPDKHGLIFSGSAVVDRNNTSGFGTTEQPPLVAIFTYHLMDGEKAGRTDFQTQGIAYSLDNGDSWTKYEGNPVVQNDGNKDFRDPKVFWNDIAETWSMLLVAGDHLQVWNSENLKDWKKVSEFGRDKGAHGGVWECPDMFPLKVEGSDEVKWVLLISINPGAPNGGSGTQYFIGDFDGTTFSTNQTENKWLDLGRDNYAGVTYNNTPKDERVFIGWMSNWDYARDTPTDKWRGAMTLPRNLSLHNINGELLLFNYPLEQLDNLLADAHTEPTMVLEGSQHKNIGLEHGNQSQIRFLLRNPQVQLLFSNAMGDSLKIFIDANKELVTLDRSASGRTDFSDAFALGEQRMPVSHLPEDFIEVKLLLDHSSLELFLNKGQYVMTNQLFPREPYTNLTFINPGQKYVIINEFTEHKVKGIWDQKLVD